MKKRYPEVYDLNGNLIAILDKAYKIGYELVKNQLWTATFTLPINDLKLQHVLPKYHIEIYDYDRRIGRFIVNPKMTIKNEITKEVTFELEHVWSLLHSDVLFGYHQFTNHTTRLVLEELLELQEVKHWQLGTCDFTRYFHYAWENEDSLLNATRSVTEPFDEPFLWTFDDSVYPYTLNLIRPSTVVRDVIAYGKNLKGITLSEDPTNIITRIYPLGAGEGINQLTIKDVNEGVPYLEDVSAIEKYGLHKRVWADGRFEDAESLKSSAKTLLDKCKEPIRSFAIDVRDYTLNERMLKVEAFQTYSVGDVLLVHDQDANISEVQSVEKYTKNDVYGAPQDLWLELGNLVDDITTTTTDMQKKQFINDTYSQGATNILNFTYQDNADSVVSALIPFYIDDDVVNINTCELTFRTKKFRAYSSTTSGGGNYSSTTESGGGVVTTTGDTGIDVIYGWSETEPGGEDGHRHRFNDVFGHKHSITLGNHTHNVVIPPHTHEIEHGIYELETIPTSVTVKVDGNVVPVTNTSVDRLNLVDYMSKENGKITRGRHEIEIIPNGLARIEADVILRVFIQSRLGGVY